MKDLTGKLLSVDEVSRYLNLAKISIYKLTSAKKIPFIKIGKKVLFSFEKLQEWLEEKSIKPL